MSAAPVGSSSRRAVLQAVLGGNLAIDALGTVFLNVVTILVNFVVTLVLSRRLGAGGYGAFAFGFAWATVLCVPAVLGLTPLVVRNVAAYHARSAWYLLRGLLRRSNQVVVVTSLAVVAGGAGLGLLLEGSKPELLHPYLLGLLLVPIISLTTLRQAAMQGLGRVVIGRVPETLLAPLLFLVVVAAAAPILGQRFSASWAMGLLVAAQLVAFSTGILLLRRTLPARVHAAVPSYETRVWLRSALPLLLMSALMALNAQLGTIFLGSMKGAADAGVYGVASRTAVFTSFFWFAATYPLMPAVARLHAQGSHSELQRMLSRSAIVAAACTIPIALFLLVFGREFLTLFGHDFTGGLWPLRILVLGEVGKVLTGFAGLALVMTGHESSLTRGVALGAILNVGLNVLLIPLWGVEGAAVAGATSVFASNLFLVYLAWRRLRIFSLPVPIPAFAGPTGPG